jgi:mRNA-degrading endonuclease toxin of MazEF toxin-antitoxin module
MGCGSPMIHPRRGEIFAATVAGQQLRLAIVSHDKLNDTIGLILVVPMIEKALLKDTDYDALVVDGDWVLMCANVSPVPVMNLTQPLGKLSPAIVAKVDNALRIVLDLS